jgi:hypothetical protein
MDKNDLKLLSGAMIWESHLPVLAKKQLIRFVREATVPQLKIFLMDGEAVPRRKLNEVAVEVIDERFDDKIDIFKASLEKIKSAIFEK